MKLGIIGGLGPLATAYYYELLTKMSAVSQDQEHLEIFIHSCPQIPDRTAYILDHKKENPLQVMIQVAKGLEKQGADYLAIPCITAHYFHEELSQSVHIPIIHLVHEICEYLVRNHIDSVGIMATTGTISTQLFQSALKAKNISCIIPDETRQEDVMHIIYQNVKLVIDVEMDRFEHVSQELFHQGAQMIILGCTELSIVKKDYHLNDQYLDGMELLAAVALQKCQIPLKKEYQHFID